MTIHLQIPDSTIKRVTGYILLVGLCFWFFYVLFTPYYLGSSFFQIIFSPLVIFAVNIIFMSLFQKTTRRWWALPAVMSLLVFVFSMQAIHEYYPWDIIFASISNESFQQVVKNKYAYQDYVFKNTIEPIHREVQLTVYSFLKIISISLSLSFLFVKLKKHFKGKREKTENA